MPKRIPKYRHHKASGQAVVYISGRDVYLGPYNSPNSHRRYASEIAKWQARQAEAPVELRVRQLTLLYTKHAEEYYVKNGEPTSEVQSIRDALKRLNKLHRNALAGEFSPKMLKAVQALLIENGLCRTTINATVARIRRMFRWAVSEELVPTTILLGLETVRDLRRGRSEATEPRPVKPVATDDINAVLKHVSRQVKDMIRLQLLSGCRPAEIVAIRPCDVNREGEVWEYVPESHKTEHHGKERHIFLGPKAQAILAPYLDNRPAESPCFSPAEAERERRDQQGAERKTPVQPSQVKRHHERRARQHERKRKPKDAYDVASYRRAIERGCEKAGIDVWSPNRLRHSRATDLRRMFGIEAAKTVCGHSKIETTLIYAEADFARARAIMADVG